MNFETFSHHSSNRPICNTLLCLLKMLQGQHRMQSWCFYCWVTSISLISCTVLQECLCRTWLLSAFYLAISEFKRVKGDSVYSTNKVPLEHKSSEIRCLEACQRGKMQCALAIVFLLIECIALKLHVSLVCMFGCIGRIWCGWKRQTLLFRKLRREC